MGWAGIRMSGGHEACSPQLSALTLVMVACLGDHEAGQIGVCGLALEGLEPGSEVREHQVATVLHSPWSQRRIARRSPAATRRLASASGILWSRGS